MTIHYHYGEKQLLYVLHHPHPVHYDHHDHHDHNSLLLCCITRILIIKENIKQTHTLVPVMIVSSLVLECPIIDHRDENESANVRV